MILGFIISLILAWPTYGISIIIFLIFSITRAYINAKSAKNDVDVRIAKRRVSDGASRFPSWASTADSVEAFFWSIKKILNSRGVSDIDIERYFSNEDRMEQLGFLAAELEAMGASYEEQQLAVLNEINLSLKKR